MEYRQLGNTDLKPSVIGLGCNKIANTNSTEDRIEVERTLAAALDGGINFFDTADVYSKGESERLLGQALRGKRDRVLICSKAGHVTGGWRSSLRRLKRPVKKLLGRWQAAETAARNIANKAKSAPSAVPLNFAPGYIRRSIETSLRRLNTDYLDVFLLHNPPPEVAGDNALFGMLARLKDAGHIRHFGISLSGHNKTNDLLPFLEIPGPAVVQLLVNPVRMVDLDRIAPLAKGKGVGIIARQPFHKAAAFAHRPLLDLAAANPAYSPAQMAIRFGLQQDGVGVLIAGMRSRPHLDEALGALDGPELTAAEMAALRATVEVA